MKLLVDSCIGLVVVNALKKEGYDVKWTQDLKADPGDIEILAFAKNENRVLITLDKDFGELAIVFDKPHSGVLRLVGFSTREQGDVALKLLKSHHKELNSGALITVDRRKIRVRRDRLGDI